MVSIYATLIIHDRKKLAEIPEDLRDAVIAKLLVMGYDEEGHKIS